MTQPVKDLGYIPINYDSYFEFFPYIQLVLNILVDKKQVRNLCVYSRPGDRFWLCAISCVFVAISVCRPIGWAKGPSSSLLLLPPSLPPSLPYSANVKLTARLSALAVRKRGP